MGREEWRAEARGAIKEAKEEGVGEVIKLLEQGYSLEEVKKIMAARLTEWSGNLDNKV